MAFMPPAMFAEAFAPRSLGVTSGATRRPFNSFFFASLIAMTGPQCARLERCSAGHALSHRSKAQHQRSGRVTGAGANDSAQESANNRRLGQGRAVGEIFRLTAPTVSISTPVGHSWQLVFSIC